MFHGTNFTESSESYETLEALMKAASLMYDFAKQEPEGSDRDQLITHFANDAYMNRRGLAIEDMPTEGFLNDEHMAIWTILASRSHWFARWGDLAYPRIQTSHSYAAQLMATTLSKKEIPFIEAPWPAFIVEVPEGLLPIATKDGTMTHITRIHVNASFLPSLWTEPWWSLELTGNGIEIHRVGAIVEAFDPATKRDLNGRSLIELPDSFGTQTKDMPVGGELEEGRLEDFWDGYNRSQEDRVAILAARLVLGACIMLTDKANYKTKDVRIDPGLAGLRRRAGKEPTSRVYVLGRPVQVDFRLAVREFIKGASRSLSVQSLVAGHHKHQPHGPDNSLRKWIFVAPYWRGEVDAPIVVRSHVLDP